MAVQALGLGLSCQECDDKLQVERGCKKKGVLPFNIDGETVFRCPLKSVTDLSWEYIRAYMFYKKNILPHGKGWLEENGKFLDAMTVLDSASNALDNKKMKGARSGKDKRSPRHTPQT